MELWSNLLLIADPLLVTFVVMKIASWRSYDGCFKERVTVIRPLRQIKVSNDDLMLDETREEFLLLFDPKGCHAKAENERFFTANLVMKLQPH